MHRGSPQRKTGSDTRENFLLIFQGLPRSVSINRAQFDVGLEATQASSKEGNPAKRQAYLEISGFTGSYSENAVFEQIHGFDSVSAVKAIQASAQPPSQGEQSNGEKPPIAG